MHNAVLFPVGGVLVGEFEIRIIRAFADLFAIGQEMIQPPYV